MDSFTKWLGGKKLLRKHIIPLFPPHKTYVEVFGGGGWILFEKQRSAFEIYNDISGDLTNLFKQMKCHPNELISELRYLIYSRDLFRQLREYNPITEIQRAARFWFLVNYSYAAKTEQFGGTSPRHAPCSLINKLENFNTASERLDKVTVENLHYLKCIGKFDTPETFFYLDPPYYQTEDYAHVGVSFKLDDHIQLRDTLLHIKGTFILSYNDHQKIRDLYSSFKIEAISRNNNMGKGEYRELMIRNFK